MGVLKSTTWLLCLGLTLLVTVVYCGGNDKREEILVFAAASLADVMERLGRQFTEAQGVEVSFNLGASTPLAQQIIRGAPADAFLSAGSRPMDVLEQEGMLAPGTRVELLTNELVLAGSPGLAEERGIASVDDLVNADTIVAIADPDLAPAGRYAREALLNLGLWQKLEPRMAFALDVRVALGYVETGNADVGLVYRTDLRVSEALEIIAPIPKGSYSPIIYPAGVIAGSEHTEGAQKFLAYLQENEATSIFREFGFSPYLRE